MPKKGSGNSGKSLRKKAVESSSDEEARAVRAAAVETQKRKKDYVEDKKQVKKQRRQGYEQAAKDAAVACSFDEQCPPRTLSELKNMLKKDIISRGMRFGSKAALQAILSLLMHACIRVCARVSGLADDVRVRACLRVRFSFSWRVRVRSCVCVTTCACVCASRARTDSGHDAARRIRAERETRQEGDCEGGSHGSQ